MKATGRSYADNALEHGVSGINVDACRVGGRFPANVVLDEQAAAQLDEEAGNKGGGFGISGGNPEGKGIYNKNFPRGDHRVVGYGDAGGASRFFYCAKASKKERGEGCDHPTVKPLALMRWLVRLVKMPSGTVVLDPFLGSGTTGLACREEEVDFVGIERDPHYMEIARRRLGAQEAE